MPFDDFTLAQHSEPDFGAIRAQAAELITFIRQPLPANDPGLIEAERRLHAIDDAVAQLTPADLPFPVAERIVPITDAIFIAADDALNRLIDHRPPRTLAGAAVKIRLIVRDDPDSRSLRQVLALIEREVRR